MVDAVTNDFIHTFMRELESCEHIESDFYSTFKFTKTGNNFCHARTLGLLTKVAWQIKGVACVEVDVRLNNRIGRLRFQPDLLLRGPDGEIILAVDFESPNSSDARIPYKDVIPYVEWSKDLTRRFPYLVITSLPDLESPSWEHRYASGDGCNAGHKASKVRANPFRYWYAFYRKSIGKKCHNYPITFANLNGNSLNIIDLDSNDF